MEKPTAAGIRVEYTDPSGIYPAVARELHERLPLKGLHWNNSSGFIRSIDNLYIELVPDDRSNPTPDSTSFDGSSAGHDNIPVTKSEGSKKERRHQFPGLRRTPYLKIYLLKCADVDTYRASSRKVLRDWVKDHTPSAQSSSQLDKQENHDAFEWLIVHVLPSPTDGFTGTKSDGVAEKRPTTSRWPSRSSTSVIEKIRADFNGTSKHTVDRVAQVQLTERSADESVQVKRQSQDDQNGWADLASKLKSLILASFGLRVSQYEEDIKEKEMQRSLPGWNFNTFFVLKEGLAMGFENMGLVEDALTVYRELAVGLAAVIDGQEEDKVDNQQTTHFSLCTDELKAAFEQALTVNRRNGEQGNENIRHTLDLGAMILDTDRKPFRNLILESNISVFDFQSYVFARQMTLLLRLANATFQKSVAIKGTPSNEPDAEIAHLSNPNQVHSVNLTILAESIELSKEFISSVAQTVRKEIEDIIKQSDSSYDEEPGVLDAIKDNLTSSWTFSACECILGATLAAQLSKQMEPLLRQLKHKTVSKSSHDGDQSTNVVHRNELPARTSSLPSQIARPKSPPQGSFSSITSSDAMRLLPPASRHPGTAELAAQRGELLALERRVLSNIGLRHGGWRGSLADIASIYALEDDNLQDVKLDDESIHENNAVQDSVGHSETATSAGIYNSSILTALESKSDFYAAYEDLTTSALASYVVGDRRKATEAMTADLAVIRFQLKQYDVAASYFRQLAPFYAKDEWSNLEIVMLNMYANCLSHLQRAEDYVRVASRALAKMVQNQLGATGEPRTGSPDLLSTDQNPSYTTVSLRDIIAASTSLEQPVSVPMDQFFDHAVLDKYIHHFTEHDGFALFLRFRSLLPGSLEADSVRVRLTSAGEEQRPELWLTVDGPQIIRAGQNKIKLRSKMMLPSWYVLGNISIQSANLIFVNDASPTSSVSLLTKSRDSMTSKWNLRDQARFLIWPAPRSLEARVKHSEYINLELPRSINVEISNGENNVSQGKLLLRAASAGLRLHTAKALVDKGELKIIDKTLPGTITFDGFPVGTKASIRVPYSVEDDLKDIDVRLEVTYTTSEGDFTYACNSKVSILLPLAINVQDIFKKNTLFSRFTIGTANSVPLRIFNCHLEGNENFSVNSPALTGVELDVFDLQPLSFISRIQNRLDRQNGIGKSEPIKRRLHLQIEFRCLDEEIFATAENLFCAALNRSPFQVYSRILTPMLSAKLRKSFSVQRLEAGILQREFYLGKFDEREWESQLSGLTIEQRQLLAVWLKTWHEEQQTIRLEEGSNLSPMQYLTVPVDVPQVQVLHIVRLKQSHPISSDIELHAVPIGKAVPMELIITYTRYWDDPQRQRPRNETLDFYYEMQANSDWLIGGQRKTHYTASEDEVLTFSLLLWPQRTGNLLFPPIEIHYIARSKDGHSENDLARESTIASEIDYQDQSRTILVVPDLLSTTVNLDPGGEGGGWLVESQSRST